MTLNDLSKEQKQYLMLGVLAAAIVIILMVLGVRFSLSSIQDAKLELADLTGKIESADRTLNRRSQVNADFRETMKVLRDHFRNAPPDRNYYSWATEVIYSSARRVGLEIDSIDEMGGVQSKGAAADQENIRLESYALRITAHGGYENVKRFIRGIKSDYPLARFTGMDITIGKSPESHDIQLWVQWPLNLASITEGWETALLPEEPAVQPAVGHLPEDDIVQDQPAEAAPESEEQPEPEIPVAPPVEEEPILAPVTVPAATSEPTPPPPRVEPEMEEIREPEPPAELIVPDEPQMELENAAGPAEDSDIVPEPVIEPPLSDDQPNPDTAFVTEQEMVEEFTPESILPPVDADWADTGVDPVEDDAAEMPAVEDASSSAFNWGWMTNEAPPVAADEIEPAGIPESQIPDGIDEEVVRDELAGDSSEWADTGVDPVEADADETPAVEQAPWSAFTWGWMTNEAPPVAADDVEPAGMPESAIPDGIDDEEVVMNEFAGDSSEWADTGVDPVEDDADEMPSVEEASWSAFTWEWMTNDTPSTAAEDVESAGMPESEIPEGIDDDAEAMDDADGDFTTYDTTEAGTQQVDELLKQDEPDTSGSINDLLDSLMEVSNEIN